MNCGSIIPSDLNSIVGKWKLIEKVDKELWLERIEENESGIFNFYKNGTIVFKNQEPKTNKQLAEEYNKIKGWCGNSFMLVGRYNTFIRMGKWKAEKDVISISYYRGKELHNIRYRVKYIRENNLDIERVYFN